MSARETLQRIVSAGAGVSAYRLKNNILNSDELFAVAKWWSGRYKDGEEVYKKYTLQKSFKELHRELQELELKDNRFEILVYPDLTLATIRSEIERKMHTLQPRLIVVDYINKVRVGNLSNKSQFDWTEQIVVANGLKLLAQKYNVPILAPYQIDASGEARFAKGIIDSANTAFTLDAHKKQDGAITFNCTKMRGGNDEVSFTTKMDWETLKMGPDNGILPTKEVAEEAGDDIPWN
jgi:replicative DNA helicase